ncbi:MAG: hypothetical protein K2W96_26585, partial [Gemmataceae bacterium]|nr:hypothetical protein [Gemmataceae bacterium]
MPALLLLCLAVPRLPELPEPTTLKGHARDLSAITYSPDGKTLATASAEGVVKFWDAATLKEAGGFKTDKALWSMAWRPDGKRIALGIGSTVVVTDAAGKPLAKLEGHKGNVWNVVYDGKRLASACERGIVKVRDAETHKELKELLIGHPPEEKYL